MAARLLLFASPAIEYREEVFALPFERRTQLLALLALKRSWVGRAELAGMLWPGQESKLAYANLRKTLFRLQSLPRVPRIESQDGALRLEAQTDVHAFESALRERRFGEALPLRRGELLAGFEDDGNEAWTSWLSFERERLRAAWRGAALSHLAGEIDPGEAIDLSGQLLDADPLDEAALRAHMAWLARSGQGAAAREAYRKFVERLAADLGLAPGAELRALDDSLRGAAGSALTAAAPAAADDGFVGRAIELRRMAELLAQADCRLLCLVGPGGVGKTRLAMRAMGDLAREFPDGTVFVPLEDVDSPQEFGRRIVHDLGAAPGTGDALEQAIELLRDRRMLLVLDNFDSLAPQAPILRRLLQGCAGLKIVVTSRVRLALAEEWLLPLDGLPCPEAEDRDLLEGFDASRLFVRAARRVQPALVPAAEAAAIVDICRQVEGLPLALELAAAWTRVLSCESIAAELRHGTELLRAVDAVLPARHASIEIVFDQSWRLLTAVERDALARLSVFRGGFSPEAARAVASAPLPVLGALADQSLLRREDTRIFLHPLVHQMAAVRLGDGEARAATEAAHARYFHRQLAQLRRAVDDGDREALHWMDVEFENCRIAWRWSVAHEQGEALARSAPALLHYCDHRSRPEEGLALFREAADSPRLGAEPKTGALMLASAAHLEYRLDRYTVAESDAARALAMARAARDPDATFQCLNVLGSCCLRLGRQRDATRFFKQALQQARANTDPHKAAAMLDNLALVEKATGRRAEALALSVESLAQHRRLGDAAGEALCLNNLGVLYMEQEPGAARANLLEGLAICDRDGLVGTRGLILANLTELAVNMNDQESAQAYAERALEFARTSGNRIVVSWLRIQIARLALRRGDLPGARSELVAALEIAIAIGGPYLQLSGVALFGDLLAAQGEPDCARLVLAFVADHPLTNALERDAIRARLAAWPQGAGARAAWPGLALGELVHRIAVEAGISHSGLIALLKGAG
ncbi:MAG TPA: tetratricopeptide repeat protein [Usitatibacter sp.]|nr:tetratricopeptide repeat protein [Usitatibacter sp.]